VGLANTQNKHPDFIYYWAAPIIVGNDCSIAFMLRIHSIAL
jgi:hypothetical protein